jgi:methanogenic corrinoid protein MtbC1/DNA-binding XRE family transcriptional regulator
MNKNDARLNTIREQFLNSAVRGDASSALVAVESALKLGIDIREIYNSVIIPTQIEIGEKWHRHELNIAHEHRATEIAHDVMSKLRMSRKVDFKLGLSAVITSIEGDSHSFGARIFADFLLFDGWSVEFLGANTPIEDLVSFVKDNKPNIVGLSISVNEYLDLTIKAIKLLKGLKTPPKIIVGGKAAADSSQLLKQSGADSICLSATDACLEAKNLVGYGTSGGDLSSYLKDLGKRIQTLRKSQNLSQQQLSDGSDLDRTYISAVEHGKQNVTLGAVFRISQALKVPFEKILVKD